MREDSQPYSRPYIVGYGKPPEDYQYKKGKSGNPKGRPRGSRNMAVLFRKGLDDKVAITEKGKQKKITVREAIVQRALIEAMKGKDKAIERIMKIYARHFKAEEDLPAQAVKAQEAYLETLSVEELQEIIKKYNAAAEENKIRNKRQEEERAKRRDAAAKAAAAAQPKNNK